MIVYLSLLAGKFPGGGLEGPLLVRSLLQLSLPHSAALAPNGVPGTVGLKRGNGFKYTSSIKKKFQIHIFLYTF